MNSEFPSPNAHRAAEQAASSTSSLISKGFPLPCTAGVSSHQASLLSGLTTASVASADTTLTVDSSSSHPLRLHPSIDLAGAWAPKGGLVVDVARASSNAAEVPSAAAAALFSAAEFASDAAGVATVLPGNLSADAAALDFPSATVPFVEHDEDDLPASALADTTSGLCCGPPPLLPSAEAQRATTVASFLQRDPSPPSAVAGGPPVEVMAVVSPEDTDLAACARSRVRVPCSLAYPPSLEPAAEADAVTSPAGAVTVSPTTCSTATTTHFNPSLRRSRSFEAPLPNCSSYASADDLVGLRSGDRRASSFSDYCQAVRQGHAAAPPAPPQRPPWAPGFAGDISDSTLTVSAITTPVTTHGAAAPNAAAVPRAADEVAVVSSPYRNRSSPRSLSDGGGNNGGNGPASTVSASAAFPSGGNIPRVRSMDTMTTVSSTRSRPALTPAATGLPGTNTSTAASTTTITSVTYTRKNVSLGALDFYGNPVTSLSTLLAQMSVRSGDREEMEQLDLRHAAQQQQQQQQQQKNTLSMQNLKAHTQQVGEMGPEDKIKRLRGKSETVAAAASMLRRRRASCPAPGSTAGPISSSPATTAAAAANANASNSAAGKPQVGCLKDVLQECNFLCINDVISAIVETQAHELHEAQQQLDAAAMSHTALETSTAASAAVAAAAASEGVASPSRVSSPRLRRTASLPTSAWSEDGGSPLVRGATCSGFANTGTMTSVPGLPPSTDSIDPQHALSLAAAITEVSLNLERASEVSSSMSTLITTATGAPRSHLLRAASGRTATTSLCEGTTQSMTSGSLPNLTSEMPIAVSHTSTVITPVQLRPPVPSSYSSRALSSPAEATPPYSNTVTVFPEDPLERKVLRSSSSDVITEGNRSVTSARSAGAADVAAADEKTTRNAATPTGTVSGAAPCREATPPATAAAADGDTHLYEKCSGGKVKNNASPWLVLAGRYVPNWHGLAAAGEEYAATSTTVGAVPGLPLGRLNEGVIRVDGCCNGAVPPPPPICVSDDHDCLARSIIGELEDMGDCAVTEVSSQEQTGTSNSATEVRVQIDCMTCASFDDEVTTVRELRKWARCVAQQELLQPSTETEVTT